jgi:hypothetical protein
MEFAEKSYTPETEKPRVLYHASSNRSIVEFEPRAITIRDPEEGSVVFATPDFAMTTCFIVNYPFVQSGAFNGMHYAVIADKEKFLEADTGGAIYTLPSATFQNDPEKGLGDKEWTSKELVKPSEKVEVTSGLEAMLDNGVQVYFVDKQQYNEIVHAADHGLSLLHSLQSENEIRGTNLKQLPDEA